MDGIAEVDASILNFKHFFFNFKMKYEIFIQNII